MNVIESFAFDTAGAGDPHQNYKFRLHSLREDLSDVGGVEVGFEEERVVAFGGVHGDVDGGDVGLFQVADEFCLFLGVEAEVGVDGEDEEFMPGGLAAGEEFFV